MADRARRKRRRLSRSGEFERVYREGRSHASRHLVVYAFPRSDDESDPRLGISVGRKLGGAVERNRMKRLLREAFWADAGDLRAGARLRDRGAAGGGRAGPRRRRAGDRAGAARGARRGWPRAWRGGRGVSAFRGVADRADPPLPARDLAGVAVALQVPSVVLRVRGPGRPPLRCAARSRPRRLAAAALQSLEPRRSRLRRGPDPLPHATERLADARHPQPLIDACQWILEFWHDLVGGSLGLVDHPADLHGPDRDPAADVQGREVDAAPADAAAGDQGDPGALQGRPPAHEPGGHGLLPAREGQPARVLPAAGPADPVLHLALLPAALERVQGGHRGQCGVRSDRQPGPDGQLQRSAGAAGHPDRPLRRHAARGDDGHGVQRRPHAAPDHARAAVRLRDLHRQLPGRADRVLDHHERLDDRPAAAGQEALPEARAAGGGRHARMPQPARGKPPAEAATAAAVADGKPAKAQKASGDGNGGPVKAPPRSPRKKKKRSGRRR